MAGKTAFCFLVLWASPPPRAASPPASGLRARRLSPGPGARPSIGAECTVLDLTVQTMFASQRFLNTIVFTLAI